MTVHCDGSQACDAPGIPPHQLAAGQHSSRPATASLRILERARSTISIAKGTHTLQPSSSPLSHIPLQAFDSATPASMYPDLPTLATTAASILVPSQHHLDPCY